MWLKMGKVWVELLIIFYYFKEFDKLCEIRELVVWYCKIVFDKWELIGNENSCGNDGNGLW